jgi:hypothetical protein
MNTSAEMLATVNDRLSNRVRSRIGSGCGAGAARRSGSGHPPAAPRRARVAPAPHLRAREAERDAGERDGDQQGAAVVGAVFAVDAGVSTRTRRPAMNIATTDRQVDPERGAPIGERDGERSEARPAGDAERTDAAPHGDDLRAALQRERCEQQAERRRGDHGAADSLDGSTERSARRAGCERGDQRADGEHGEPEQEHAAAPDLVGHLAG